MLFRSAATVRRSRRGRRASAALLLLGSLGLLLGSQGSGFAVLLWGLLLSCAGFCVAQTLSWKPRWLRWLLPTRR